LTTPDERGTVKGVNIAAGRVRMLLQHGASALCVECLAKASAVPLVTLAAMTTDLLEAGIVVTAPGDSCQVCGKQPALKATGVQ
jgi:hypothetical protein